MQCFSCDYEGNKRGLGSHYGSSPDHRPALSDEQHDIITGLLMGDGHINRSKKTPNLRAEMINKEYLQYLDNKFPHISLGVTKSRTSSQQAKNHRDSGFNTDASSDTYSDCYWWETMAHQELFEYADWYESGEKTFPDNIEISPTILKHWYVCDGGLNDGSIRIYLHNERNNKDKIQRYFDSVCKDNIAWSEVDRGNRSHTSINFTRRDTDHLLSYMEGPLPGFSRKWNRKL